MDRLALLITSERCLTVDRVEGRDVVTMEVWFSGVYRMQVVREAFMCYLEFLVSEEVWPCFVALCVDLPVV